MNIDHLRKMAHSPIRNYIVPGLTSWLIGEKSAAGCVRMFECERSHEEAITPHSHRFDFACVVLQGAVRNVIWKRDTLGTGDLFAGRTIIYGGSPGAYSSDCSPKVHRYTRTERRFTAGQQYGMTHDEVHSIFFERSTFVLFFEGPSITNETTVLEPWCDGMPVPTFEVRPWMFQRRAA